MTYAPDSGMPSPINPINVPHALLRAVSRLISTRSWNKTTSALLLIGLCKFATAATTFTYHIAGDEPGPWPQILSSIDLTKAAGGPANLFIVPKVAPASVQQCLQPIQQGSIS